VIDDGNNSDWPEAVTKKLAAYRQGSLVRSPPFAYHAAADYPIWVATGLVEPGAESPVLVELDPRDRPPYGIITSHSCDVDEEGRNRKPWVQIAPVYELPKDQTDLGNIHRWRVAYIAPVTGLGPQWVADLRIECPVEKSWLVGQQPIDGFRDQADYDQFSCFCGNYRRRQAIATSIYDQVLTPLELALRLLARGNRNLYTIFSDKVDHLFLDISGDALQPATVQLIFVSQEPLPSDLVEHLELWWEQRFGATTPPFTLLRNRYLSYDQVSFAEYRHWREQDLARLLSSS
jgi:hypothetical protein